MTETTEIPEATRRAMDKAKIALMAAPDTTFFTTVLFSLMHIWDWKIPTACTNGRWIRFNPDFFMKCSQEEQIGLMLHEAMHVIWLHMVRLGDRDAVKWNVATDYVINLMIIDRGFKLPAGALIDEQYRDLSAEEVYDLLPEQDPSEVEIHFEAGDPGDPSDTTAEEKEALERDIQDVLIRAQMQSKIAGDKPGTIPGEIELYLKRLLKPRLPTAALLRKFFTDMAKNDYTWRRPNRRFFPKHHLPSMYSENLGHVAFFADLSASVTDKQVLRYISEVGGVMRQLRPKKLSLGAFDMVVRQVDEITSIGDLAKMGFKGRGGTEIGGVLEWAYQHDPVALVVFTDGGFYFHEAIKVPKCPVVWLINDNPSWTAPFGRVIHYDSD